MAAADAASSVGQVARRSARNPDLDTAGPGQTDGWDACALPGAFSGDQAEPRGRAAQIRAAVEKMKHTSPGGLAYYSALPDGVFLLEGAPSALDESVMMSSIHNVMVEQKRDFSLQSLPELASAEALKNEAEDHGGTGRDAAHDAAPWRMAFLNRVPWLRGRKARRVLPWVGLAGVVLIYPQFLQNVAIAIVIATILLALLYSPSFLIELVSDLYRDLRDRWHSGPTDDRI